MHGSHSGSPLHPGSIDLNADLGEGCPNDHALLELVTSASVCCNEHAGSVDAIKRTLAWAAERGVVIGAHPGYRDREGFGRRDQELSCEEVRELIVDQLGFISSLAREAGLAVRFVKPHGALYNQAQRDPEIARGVLASIEVEFRLPLIGQPGTLLERMATERSIPYVPEGFPDRRYRDDGSLVPRSEPTAVLHDPARHRGSGCAVGGGWAGRDALYPWRRSTRGRQRRACPQRLDGAGNRDSRFPG